MSISLAIYNSKFSIRTLLHKVFYLKSRVLYYLLLVFVEDSDKQDTEQQQQSEGDLEMTQVA